MPGLDRMLDPVTGDYIDAAGGEYEETVTAAPAMVHQLKGQKRRWWGDKDAGCDLYIVATKGMDGVNLARAENAALSGLQRLVEDGLIREPRAKAGTSSEQASRMELETTAIDVQTGIPLTVPTIGNR